MNEARVRFIWKLDLKFAQRDRKVPSIDSRDDFELRAGRKIFENSIMIKKVQTKAFRRDRMYYSHANENIRSKEFKKLD